MADLKIEFVGHLYSNDTNSDQDAMVVMRFKTGSSNGDYKGNAQAYKFGKQLYSPEQIRIVQDLTDSNTFRFYASYRPYADGSLIVITSSTNFTTVNTFSTDLPPGTNFHIVPIYNVFSQETPPAITDIPTLNDTVLSF